MREELVSHAYISWFDKRLLVRGDDSLKNPC